MTPSDDPIPSTFDAATAVATAEGGALVAVLDPNWNVGQGILNGGYLTAVVARAGLAGSPHPHPVAVAAGFLQATPPGTATVAVTPGPAGATLAHSSVVLTAAAGPSVVAQVATATLTVAAPEYSTAPPPSTTPVEQCLPSVDEGTLPPRWACGPVWRHGWTR